MIIASLIEIFLLLVLAISVAFIIEYVSAQIKIRKNKREKMDSQPKDEIKYISIKEFVEQGFLQEANRRFFHPLGLGLAVSTGENEEDWQLQGIWDYRKDPDGMYFDFANNFNAKALKAAREKRNNVAREENKHFDARFEKFGAIVEPLEG